MIYLALVIAALVVALVAEFEAQGRLVIGWAVVLVCVALIYASVK